MLDYATSFSGKTNGFHRLLNVGCTAQVRIQIGRIIRRKLLKDVEAADKLRCESRISPTSRIEKPVGRGLLAIQLPLHPPPFETKIEPSTQLDRRIAAVFIKPLFCLFVLIACVLQMTVPFAVLAQTDRRLERETKSPPVEKRVALVIGNGNYKNASVLPNPVNDAVDMAATLKELGFEVISGTNQTKPQMENLIRQFGTRLADTKAVGLFFYAGHGISKGGTNYLVPVEADIQAEDEVEYGSVGIDFLLGKMESAKNGFNVVILDACRNNPFARKWRNYREIGDKGGLARIDAPTGTLIAYATKPGDVASDGTGRNGLYTGALLKQMRVKNVDITKMFQRVRADVIDQSGRTSSISPAVSRCRSTNPRSSAIFISYAISCRPRTPIR